LLRRASGFPASLMALWVHLLQRFLPVIPRLDSVLHTLPTVPCSFPSPSFLISCSVIVEAPKGLLASSYVPWVSLLLNAVPASFRLANIFHRFRRSASRVTNWLLSRFGPSVTRVKSPPRLSPPNLFLFNLFSVGGTRALSYKKCFHTVHPIFRLLSVFSTTSFLNPFFSLHVHFPR